MYKNVKNILKCAWAWAEGGGVGAGQHDEDIKNILLI